MGRTVVLERFTFLRRMLANRDSRIEPRLPPAEPSKVAVNRSGHLTEVTSGVHQLTVAEAKVAKDSEQVSPLVWIGTAEHRHGVPPFSNDVALANVSGHVRHEPNLASAIRGVVVLPRMLPKHNERVFVRYRKGGGHEPA